MFHGDEHTFWRTMTPRRFAALLRSLRPVKSVRAVDDESDGSLAAYLMSRGVNV